MLHLAGASNTEVRDATVGINGKWIYAINNKRNLFVQSKKTTYQEDYIELQNAYKARKQQEKPFHSKQENNSESIKNIIQNKRTYSKQENIKRDLFIQSKKTTLNLSRMYHKNKELIQSKKTTRKISSFKARKQLRKLPQNAALHSSVISENEWATYVDIISLEYLPICIWIWMNWTRSDEWWNRRTFDEWWIIKAEDHIMNEESRRPYNEWKVEDRIMND